MNQPANSYNETEGVGYPDHNYDNSPPFQEERPINWKKYFFIFLSNWYWFLIALGIALGIAFFKIRYTIPQYQTSATLIIEEDENSQDLMGEFRSIRYLRRRTDMANEVAKLKSFSMAKRTVDEIDQNTFWTAHGRIRERPLYNNSVLEIEIIDDSVDWYMGTNWFIDILDETKYRLYHGDEIDTVLAFNREQNFSGWRFIVKKNPQVIGYNTYSFVVINPVNLANQYRSKLGIETDEKAGTLITLRSSGTVAERETDYINALCNSFIISGLDRKQKIATNTFQFIDDQIDVILDSLQESENLLLTFRLTNNVINLNREGELAYERLRGYTETKTELKLKENYYKYLQDYVETRNDPQTIISPTLANITDQVLIDAVQKLQQLYEDRENLDFSVSANNPGVESINARITSTRSRILEVIDGLMDNNRLISEQIRTEEQAVINQLKTLPINEQQLLNIKRKYDLYNQFYTFLLQKRAEAGIQKASTISNVRVLDSARYDQVVPVGTNKEIIIIIALLSGILLPAGFLFIRDFLDNRIHEREDITEATNIPLLGVIGHSTDVEKLPVWENSQTPFTESLRRIRSNVQFILRDPEKKVIMVTSSVSGEGKTFTATNLAAIFAMNNKKVLLIGCDLRRPTLHKVFNIDNSFGLSLIIIGKQSLEESIHETSVKNLTLLPAGPPPPNPAELIETEEMKRLFVKLKMEYDYIILDTPPVALVSDSLSLAEYADMSLYVIRQNFSNKDVLSIANQMNNENRLPKMGIVINDIKPSRSMGYNYYYGYNKGYSYGYFNYNEYYSKDSKS